MISLAQLFKAINIFYTKAIAQFSIIKTAAGEETLLERAKNIWGQINNPQLSVQLKNLMESYREFIRSMNVSPEDFSKEIETAAEDNAENFNDHIDALNTRFQRLISNPYLNLDADDPKYTEAIPPDQIKNIIEALTEDANNRLQQQASDAGITAEELQQAQQAASQAQQMAATTEGVNDKEIDFSNRKIKQQLESSRRARQKRALVKRIGLPALTKHRAQLKEQLENTTNLEEKRSIKQRLLELPDPESYQKNKEKQSEQFKKIMSDPAKRKEYFDRANKRQVSTREFATQFENMIARYDQATGPTEQARIKLEMVRLMKELMKKKKIDLDDDFVLNSPEVQKELNPDNIIARYRARNTRLKQETQKDWEKRRKMKEEGQLGGLIIQYRERVNNKMKDIKDALQKSLIKSPDIIPFTDAIAAAKSAGDVALLEQETKKMIAFATNYKLNHPAVKETERAVVELRTWRDALNQLDQSHALDQMPLSDEAKQQINMLISHGKELVNKYSLFSPINKQANIIIAYLVAKLEQNA